MSKLFSMTIVAVAAAVLFASDVGADNATGTCNRIIASALDTAQYCTVTDSCTPGSVECMIATNTLMEFFATPGCGDALANGDLNGLGGNAITQPGGPDAGSAKHLEEVICGSIEDCGLCPAALAFGVCPGRCMPPM